MDLNRAIGRRRAQSVRKVIAHGDLIPDFPLNLMVRHGIHFQRGLADELPQHLALRGEFDERELYTLVVREGCTEGCAVVGVVDGLLDAVDGGAEGGGGLPDAVFVDEGLGDAEAVVDGA